MLRGFQEDFPDGGIYRWLTITPIMVTYKGFLDFSLKVSFLIWKWGKLWVIWCLGINNPWKLISSDHYNSVLDGDHNGYLDFKEFQQAIDLVGARLPDDRLRWSFRLYDMDNSGSIALGEMEMVLFKD